MYTRKNLWATRYGLSLTLRVGLGCPSVELLILFSYCGVEPATVERRRNVVSTQGLSHYSLAPELCDKLLPPPAVRQSNGGSPTVISNALSASNISSTGSEPVRNLLVELEVRGVVESRAHVGVLHGTCSFFLVHHVVVTSLHVVIIFFRLR